MFPMAAAILGGSSLVGGLLSNQSSARQAERQMSFQAEQSATAHQREVADLRAAGLNPILSGTGGMGSHAGAGAMGQVSNIGESAAHSAIEGHRMSSQTKLWDAEAKGADARARRDDEIAKVIESVAPRIRDGLSALERGAKGAGEGTARFAEWLDRFSSAGSHPLGSVGEAVSGKVTDAIESVVDIATRLKRASRASAKMPPAQEPDPLRVFGVSAKAEDRIEARRLQENRDGETFRSGRERGVNWRRRPMR